MKYENGATGYFAEIQTFHAPKDSESEKGCFRKEGK